MLGRRAYKGKVQVSGGKEAKEGSLKEDTPEILRKCSSWQCCLSFVREHHMHPHCLLSLFLKSRWLCNSFREEIQARLSDKQWLNCRITLVVQPSSYLCYKTFEGYEGC